MAHLKQLEVAEESKEFRLLKPYCSEILRCPNESNFMALYKILDNIPHLEDSLSEFVVFPLAVQLKFVGKLKEKERICLFRCLAKILEKCQLKSFDLFVEIFQRLNVALVSVENPTTLNTKLSEQELDSVITCALTLLKSSISIHFADLYDENRIKIIGFFIFILLELINFDTVLKIRLHALQILDILVVSCDGKESASNRLFGFFPGIISSLRKTCSTKVGRVRKKLLLTSLSVMGHTIKVCSCHLKEENVFRVDQNLHIVIEMISEELVIHETSDFRKALLEFGVQLIPAVANKLPRCAEMLWKTIWILRSDDDCVISKNTNSFLTSFPVTNLPLCDFGSVMTLTKRSILLHKSNDSKSCLLVLKQVSSILTILRINFTELHTFFPVIFTLASHCLSLRSFTDCDNDVRLDPLVLLCSQVCQNIFIAANVDDILDEFISYFSEFDSSLESKSVSNGMIFCFNEVLRAYYKEKTDGTHIDEFQTLNLANMYISILDSESTETAICIVSEETPNLQSTAEKRKALLLEGLAVLTLISPDYVLPVSLYALIENAGTKDSIVISSVASRCLQTIADSKEVNGSISALMRKNIDLIMSELSVRISNLSVHPNCPNALLFLAEYFDFSAEDFVELVNNIFEKSCDEFNGGFMQLIYAKIFYAFISSLSFQNKEKVVNDSDSTDTKKNCKRSQKSGVAAKGLYLRLLDYQTLVGIELGKDSSDCTENVNNDENSDFQASDDGSQQRKDFDENCDHLSADLNLVLRITRRVLNFLPNNERTVRLIAMDCLIKGVIILQHHENTLLPLAHTIWQNLVPRLSEKDYVVVRKSFELLLTLCTVCGPFLKKRTLEDVFPKLSSLLIALTEESKKVKNKFRQYYTYTQGYKLQLTVLQGMAQLCECIEVNEEDLMKVVDGAIMYLEPEHHKNLKDAALKLLNWIANGPNCRSIWLSLVANGLKDPPINMNSTFTPLPLELLVTNKKYNARDLKS